MPARRRGRADITANGWPTCATDFRIEHDVPCSIGDGLWSSSRYRRRRSFCSVTLRRPALVNPPGAEAPRRRTRPGLNGRPPSPICGLALTG